MNFITTLKETTFGWIKGSARYLVFTSVSFFLCCYLTVHLINNTSPSTKVIWSAVVLLLGSLSLKIFQENGFKYNQTVFGYILLILLTLGLYMVYPADIVSQVQWPIISFIGIVILLHLLVSVAPFVKQRNDAHFLRYNMQVFENFVESALMSLILYAAICLAASAIDTLFNTSITRGNFYGVTAIWVFIFLHSINFLSVFPKMPLQVSSLNEYRGRFFKVLTQYIGIPVVIVYNIILYAYIGKVLFMPDEIKEWSEIFCLWFMVAGIFIYLCNRVYLLYNEGKLANLYDKWFFYSNAIPTVFLWFRVIKRLQEEGITMELYLYASVALASTIATIYFLNASRKDLRIVPLIVMAITAIAILPTPLSIYNLPLSNQKERLFHFLREDGYLKDNVLNPIKSKGKHTSKIIKSMNYVYNYDTTNVFKNLKGVIKKEESTDPYRIQIALGITESLGVDAVQKLAQYIYHPDAKIPLNGYKELLPFKVNSGNEPNYNGVSFESNNEFWYIENGGKKYKYQWDTTIKKDQKTLTLTAAKDTVDIFIKNLNYHQNAIEYIEGLALRK
jgi:hypothetical protein